MGLGTVSVVDAGHHDPRMLARIGRQGCTARADMTVGKREQRLVDTLVSGVEAVDEQRPTASLCHGGQRALAPAA